MIFGIHCSVLKGFSAALDEALALGCPAMQMLPYRRHHNPRDEDMEAFRLRRAASAVRRLFIHSRFVPNLASSNESLRERSIEMLSWELSLCKKLGAEAFVLHAGAYSPGVELKDGEALFIEAVVRASQESENNIPILLENVPGGGRRMGGTLEEVAGLLEALRRKLPQTGVCLDTAHAWAAGYDIASVEGMLKFLARFNRLIGAEACRVFHLNDTRALLGSHREHHAHWGEGYLGPEGLRTLLDRPEYESAVAILETPKALGADRRNLDYVLGLEV